MAQAERSAPAGSWMPPGSPHCWPGRTAGGGRIPSIPTAACWSRWKGVKDWDGRELAAEISRNGLPRSMARAARRPITSSATAGGAGGFRSKGGDMSVGVVFDQRLVEWPQDGGRLGDRLKAFPHAAPGRPRDAGGCDLSTRPMCTGGRTWRITAPHSRGMDSCWWAMRRRSWTRFTARGWIGFLSPPAARRI